MMQNLRLSDLSLRHRAERIDTYTKPDMRDQSPSRESPEKSPCKGDAKKELSLNLKKQQQKPCLLLTPSTCDGYDSPYSQSFQAEISPSKPTPTIITKYTGVYDRAEKFLEKEGFAFVIVSEEIKTRNYPKVLSQTTSTHTEEDTSSPLYVSSPRLQKLCTSSLFSRRSNTASPLPLNDDGNTFHSDDDRTPNSARNKSSVPLKLSRFGSESRRNSVDTADIEKRVPHDFNRVPPIVTKIKPASELLAMYSKNNAVIEVNSPFTPSEDSTLFEHCPSSGMSLKSPDCSKQHTPTVDSTEIATPVETN